MQVAAVRVTAALALVAGAAGCEATYPELVVVNATDAPILVRNASWQGCLFEEVLALGDATPPGRCLPGADKVHFQKLDVTEWCQRLASDGIGDARCGGATFDAGAGADAGTGASGDADGGVAAKVPLWFNYQTRATYTAGYGDFLRVALTVDGWEQDFSVPGPYGH